MECSYHLWIVLNLASLSTLCQTIHSIHSKTGSHSSLQTFTSVNCKAQKPLSTEVYESGLRRRPNMVTMTYPGHLQMICMPLLTKSNKATIPGGEFHFVTKVPCPRICQSG